MNVVRDGDDYNQVLITNHRLRELLAIEKCAEQAEATVTALRQQLDQRDEAHLAAIPESYATLVDHYREMARRFAESRDELKHRCRQLDSHGAVLRATLEQVEWTTCNRDGVLFLACPWCGGYKPLHVFDCPRQAAFAASAPQQEHYRSFEDVK